MYTRLHVQRKRPLSSAAQPPQSYFRQRPFKADDTAASPPESATLNLQAQTQKNTRFSHNFGQVQVDDSLPADIQTKLAIGQPGDRYEEEADTVANQVMRMPDPANSLPIQRLSEETGDSLQRQPLAASITPLIQREVVPDKEDEDKINPLQTKAIQREVVPDKEDEDKISHLQTKAIQREVVPGEEEKDEDTINPLQTKVIQREVVPGEEEKDEDTINPLQTKVIQREVVPGEEDEDKISHLQTKAIQRQDNPSEEKEEEDLVAQTKPSTQNREKNDATPTIESRLASQKGGGNPLPDEVRSFMEPRFGADFSQVRVHTDSEANQMNQELQAQAFTQGSDLYFGAGRYNPGSSEGKHLLAHELTHVIQQTGGVQLKPQTKQSPVKTATQEQREQALAEWNAHPKIHRHFNKPSFETYLELRPLYQGKGIQNPAEYLDKNIVPVTFFGKTTPAHIDMRAPLQTAQQILQSQNSPPQLDYFYSFVPRKTAKGILSKHALGRAVDINHNRNPWVLNREEILVIEAATGVNLGQLQTYVDMRRASQKFQETFTQSWVDKQTQELKDLEDQGNVAQNKKQSTKELQHLIDAINKRRTELDKYARFGFLNLDQALVDALIKAKLEWGGHWIKSKDFMHFELPKY